MQTHIKAVKWEKIGIDQLKDTGLAVVKKIMNISGNKKKMSGFFTSADKCQLHRTDPSVWSSLVRSVTGPNDQF